MKSSIRLAWHIFKKDVRLLWPFILGTAGVQFALAGVQYMFDRGNVPDAETLSHLYDLLVPATLLSAGFLIAMAVHQDTIPGVRQDWLVRPVKRRDLVLAKLLFVLVMVHGPILLADTFQALVNGFSLGQSLSSSATRGLLLLGFVSLPVLAFASLTQNMTQAVIGGVIVFVTSAVSIQLQAGLAHSPTASTGLVWISLCSTTVVLLVGATIIFTVQYFRRKTVLSRWLAVCVFVLAYLMRFTPWDLAFRLQQRLSAVPGAGRSIVAAYEPSLGKFRLPEGMDRNAAVSRGAGMRDEASTVYVPLVFLIMQY